MLLEFLHLLLLLLPHRFRFLFEFGDFRHLSLQLLFVVLLFCGHCFELVLEELFLDEDLVLGEGCRAALRALDEELQAGELFCVFVELFGLEFAQALFQYSNILLKITYFPLQHLILLFNPTHIPHCTLYFLFPNFPTLPTLPFLPFTHPNQLPHLLRQQLLYRPLQLRNFILVAEPHFRHDDLEPQLLLFQ
jgi:hypothetical protein